MLKITKDLLKRDIDLFSDDQLKQIANFFAFIKFQTKLSRQKSDISQFANLYQEFEKEDRELAERVRPLSDTP